MKGDLGSWVLGMYFGRHYLPRDILGANCTRHVIVCFDQREEAEYIKLVLPRIINLAWKLLILHKAWSYEKAPPKFRF
jgi:hypothetical protein